MVRQIELTGKHAIGEHRFAVVDDADYTWLQQWRWMARKSRRTAYARRTTTINGRRIAVWMHREILGLGRSDRRQSDHIDHDGLNNQRANLRAVSQTENARNARIEQQHGACRYCGRQFTVIKRAPGRRNLFCSESCRRQNELPGKRRWWNANRSKDATADKNRVRC